MGMAPKGTEPCYKKKKPDDEVEWHVVEGYTNRLVCTTADETIADLVIYFKLSGQPSHFPRYPRGEYVGRA